MFGILEAWNAREVFNAEMRRRWKKRPRATDLGESKCRRCGNCCWQRPPRLSPEDLERLAQLKELTPREFFERYCVVDDPGNSELGPVLIRASQRSYAGEWLPDSETFSLEAPCIFLDDEQGVARCKVHAHKPEECRGMECWDVREHAERHAWTTAELCALGYGGL